MVFRNQSAHMVVAPLSATVWASLLVLSMLVCSIQASAQSTMAQRARDLNGQMEYADAAVIFEQLVEINERELGPMHAETLWVISGLGISYLGLDRYAEAEALFRRSLAGRERSPRRSAHLIPANYFNLGDAIAQQGRFAEAQPYLLRGYNGRVRANGLNDRTALQMAHNLGGAYNRIGRYDEAERYLVRALEGRIQLLGTGHFRTRRTRRRLAITYMNQGKHPEAEQLAFQEFDYAVNRSGAENIMASHILVGTIYQAQGSYSEAEARFRQSLTNATRIYGTEHAITPITMSRLGTLYMEQGRYAEAEQFLREAVQLLENLSGESHPETVRARNNLSSLLVMRQETHEAEQLARRNYGIAQGQLGPDQADTLSAATNLAVTLQDQGRYAEAEEIFLDVLERSERTLGPESERTTAARSNIESLRRLARPENAVANAGSTTCLTVVDVVIANGEEVRAESNMCRTPPSARWVRA